MDNAKHLEFSEIATRAILESLSPSRREIGEYSQKAIFHASDPDFRAIMDGVASGMGLAVNRVSNRVGVVLSVKDENSPFSPGLGWLSNRLSNTQQHNRDELHCFAILTLTALLSEAFPSEHSTGLEWSSPAQFNIDDVLNKLHGQAEEIVSQVCTPMNGGKIQPLNAAQMIVENRLPRHPPKEGGRTSVHRSQYDCVFRRR